LAEVTTGNVGMPTCSLPLLAVVTETADSDVTTTFLSDDTISVITSRDDEVAEYTRLSNFSTADDLLVVAVVDDILWPADAVVLLLAEAAVVLLLLLALTEAMVDSSQEPAFSPTRELPRLVPNASSSSACFSFPTLEVPPVLTSLRRSPPSSSSCLPFLPLVALPARPSTRVVAALFSSSC
jgi:hypothetical protein